MLSIALELAKHNPTYEDIASKFFEHFLYIADAMTYPAGNEQKLSLWDDKDGLYFDAIQWGFGHAQLLPVRSMVSLTPLYGTLVIEPGVLKRFPGFKKVSYYRSFLTVSASSGLSRTGPTSRLETLQT